MKKIFLIITIFCLSLVIISCGDSGSESQTPNKETPIQHEHSVSTSWSYDGENHWKTCGGCTELIDKSAHVFDSGKVTTEPTVDKEGVKTFSCECGYSYTEKIDKVEIPTPAGEREIVVDYETQTIYVPAERDLRIAQFADLHIKRGYDFDAIDCSNDKLERTYDFIDQIISETDPDIIVCSGDNILTTGTAGLEEFIQLMESYKIPWVFMYGNHEAESNSVGFRKVDLSNCLKNYDTDYLIYADDYIELYKTSYKDERYGNFVMEVCDLDSKELKGAYFFLDSGVYDSSLGDYQRITLGEMDWYSDQIDQLQTRYKGKGVVPSIVFSHIQLPEFYYGYIDAQNNVNDTEFVIFQDLSNVSWDMPSIRSVLNNSPKDDNGFFDLMVEKGSSKAFLVGHAHNLWFQIKKQGILLGFGPQTGFSVGFETNYDPRKTYVYNIDSSFNMTTTSVDEPEELADGLVCKYFDSANGDYIIDNSSYDPLTGEYTLKVMYKKYSSRSKFFFNGEELFAKDITITGDVVKSSSQKTSNELYINYFDSILIFSWEGCGTYVITYNPTTKVLNVKAPDGIEKEDGSGFIYTAKYAGTTDETDVVNKVESVNGVYYLDVNFTKEYGRILFKFNGITLTPDNTTFKGVYINKDNTDWTNKLYWNPAEPGELLTATGGNYTFIYDPMTKTMAIATPDDGVFTAVKDNKDTVLSVWSNAGKEIYDGGTWIGNGWRLYVVVDAEGKIAYGVVNPVSGYGGAYAKSYFRHSDYSDYKTNPAFSYLSDPYEGQWGLTVSYKVAVPEGGFVITAYDDSKVELLRYILGITEPTPANSNTQTNNVDNVRIKYDQATGIITITK